MSTDKPLSAIPKLTCINHEHNNSPIPNTHSLNPRKTHYISNPKPHHLGRATDHIHEGVYRGLQDYARKWPYNGQFTS